MFGALGQCGKGVDGEARVGTEGRRVCRWFFQAGQAGLGEPGASGFPSGVCFLEPVAQGQEFLYLRHDAVLLGERWKWEGKNGEGGAIDRRVRLTALTLLHARDHEGAPENDPSVPREHEPVPIQDLECGARDRGRIKVGVDDGNVQEVRANARVENIAAPCDFASSAWCLSGLQHPRIGDQTGLLVDGRDVDVRKSPIRDSLTSITKDVSDSSPVPVRGQCEWRFADTRGDLPLSELPRLPQTRLLSRDPL